MRLIDADALGKFAVEADRMGAMLVVGKGHIMAAPTIDAVPVRHGRWIDEHGSLLPRCSECGEYSDDADTRSGNYCPNCGAKMGADVP